MPFAIIGFLVDLLALTMVAASFLAVTLSVVEEQPKRYSVQRVKTPK